MLLGLRFHERHHVGASGVIDSGTDAPAFDGPSPRCVGLGDEDPGGAGGVRTKHGQCADRSGSGDQDGAAGLNPASVDGIERDGGRLDHRRFLVTDGVRHLGGVVVVDDGKVGHAAPCPTQADAAHLLAEVIEPAPAVIVVHRHHERLHRNAVAAPHMRHVATNVENLGRELVAEDLRQGCRREDVRRGRRHDGAGDIFVEVSATNAGP